jgi:hypothetical protein
MTQPTEEEAAAQREVVEVARELANLRYRLKTIVADLPGPGEPVPAGELEGEPSLAIELRSAIECVVVDRLNPAIDDLERASLYRPGAATRKPGNPPDPEAPT